ncbi:NUDIX hydrolase [Reichenbachiella versicolor]|uniref:NUDIX hydrolase n=1 Tax=Reichenbachiella versicolor TaxID=1821036 RepID=UPI000D6DFE04|nr:NUDIX domain-containing protein [Reichenbachiella versicolor]
MKIYINDIPVRIKRKRVEQKKDFDYILTDSKDLKEIDRFKGKILILTEVYESIDTLLKLLTKKKHKKVKSIDIQVNDKSKAEQYLMSKFTIIRAAGGVVEKDNKILMILRNDLWDIPKGKLEKGEKKREGAVREVEEETGAKVEIVDKICTTWHTYLRNDKYVLKSTFWYRMKCLDDSKIKPQKEEGIKKAVFMSENEVDLALHHSYKTIGRLVNEYRKALKVDMV